MAWRQMRMQTVLAVAGALVFAALLLVTGPGLAEEFRTNGLTSCIVGENPNVGTLTCGDLERHFLSRQPQLRSLGPLLLLLPALLGMFWGAPAIARELESGTHRFAWVQGVTRSQWLKAKLLVPAGFTAAVIGVLAATWTWWSVPTDRLGSRIEPGAFAQRGFVPVAYAVFAVALGVVAGALVRRTVPAMALTIAGFAAARVVTQATIRPWIADAIDLRYQTFSFFDADPPGLQIARRGWMLSAMTVDAAGRVVSDGGLLSVEAEMRVCGLAIDTATKADLDACGVRLGLENVVTVVPADQFWTLQLWEAAIFGGLTAVLVCFAFWWVRRRLT